jgi:hypothetical protein
MVEKGSWSERWRFDTKKALEHLANGISVTLTSEPMQICQAQVVDRIGSVDNGSAISREELEPSGQVSQVELPWAALLTDVPGDHCRSTNCLIESDHLLYRLWRYARGQCLADDGQILRGVFLEVDLGESVQEGLGKTLSTTSLLQGVLSRKDPELGVSIE